MPLATVLCLAEVAWASPVTPGQLGLASTYRSIGIEWNVNGDDDYDENYVVDFRLVGENNWRSVMPLVRVDSDKGSMLAGSIMFLEPGTLNEVRLSLSNRDGGADTRTVNLSTMPVPKAAMPARTLHVTPGTIGGDGSIDNPYQGLTVAWSNARPGDELLMHAGYYGAVFDDEGQSGKTDDAISIRVAAADDNISAMDDAKRDLRSS